LGAESPTQGKQPSDEVAAPLEHSSDRHHHAFPVKFRFLEELKRRNVLRVAILYLVACWVILEPTHVVFHMLEVPEWANRLVILLMAIGLPMEKARKVVAIFNVCPYWSEEMGDREVRLAAGLPSVWAAQKHLREVLIKQALDGEIFLVVARKHQLWGVVEGLDCETLRLVRNRTGSLATIGSEIGDWLSKKHGIRGAT